MEPGSTEGATEKLSSNKDSSFYTTTKKPPQMESVAISIYEEILNLFTEKEDYRGWLKTPFLIGSKAVASNAHTLVAVPEWVGNYEDRSEKTKGVYPVEPNCSTVITVEKIKEAFSKVPLFDDYDEIKVECAACGGFGEVDYTFYHENASYAREFDCPVCAGDGSFVKQSTTPNGKKIPDYSKCIKIGNSVFLSSRVEELLKVVELLNAREVTLIYQCGQYTASLFKIKDVELLIMPTLANEQQMKEIITLAI